ncbi:uncharacterized protein LOC110851656 [Folsomia candida]|nr:uncharacterized protein LOC110851656 [Folsomia candida]
MVILLSGITISASCQSHLFHIFLTNWSFTLQNVYGLVLFGIVLWRWWTFKNGVLSPQQKNSTSSSSLLTLGGNNHQSIILELQNEKQQQNGYQNLTSQQNPAAEQDVEKQRGSQGSVKMGTMVNNSETPPELKLLPLTYLEKGVWILMNVVHVLPYCVVLGYWTVVYKYDPDQPTCERFKSHYIVHGATAVLAILDAFIIAIPARPTHFLVPTGLVLFYVVFTCLYEAAGGPYRPGNEFIYSVLNWKSNPKKAIIFSTLAVVVTPIAHTVFCYGVYKLRICLKSLYVRNKYRWSNSEQPN